MNEHDTAEMNKMLSHLAAAREVVKINGAELTAILEKAQKDPDYIEGSRRVDEGKHLVIQFEEMIRELAKVNFINTQDKHPHPSVQIKEFKTFKIVDPDAVRKWVDSFLRDALVVDEGKVKQYATKIGAVEGTLVGTEIRAEIASKL